MTSNSYYTDEMARQDIASLVSHDPASISLPMPAVPVTDSQDRTLFQNIIELARGAIVDTKAMSGWNKVFPGICPGCFGRHANKARWITKGMCIPCLYKRSRAFKQLAHASAGTN